LIHFEENPRSLLDRLGFRSNWHVVDSSGKRFPDNDFLSTFASTDEAATVNPREGVRLASTKIRGAAKAEDRREAIFVQCGDLGQEFRKGQIKTYAEAVAEARSILRLKDPWKIAIVMAEEDRIIINC
jgi:hypothetical protein